MRNLADWMKKWNDPEKKQPEQKTEQAAPSTLQDEKLEQVSGGGYHEFIEDFF